MNQGPTERYRIPRLCCGLLAALCLAPGLATLAGANTEQSATRSASSQSEARAVDVAPGQRWRRDEATRALTETDVRPTVQALRELAIAGADLALLDLLEATRRRDDLPAPARDAAVFEFAQSLGELPPGAVAPEVMAYLGRYTAQALVPHEDHPGGSVPLLNVRAAARGVEHRWLREEARLEGMALLRSRPGSLADAFLLESHPAARAGYLEALEQASRDQALAVVRDTNARLKRTPEITALAARAAQRSGDQAGLQNVLRYGRGPAVQHLLQALEPKDAQPSLALLAAALSSPHADNAALAMALLYPRLAGLPAADALLLDRLEDPQLGASAALALTRSPAEAAQAALANTTEQTQLVEWVETNPLNASDRIALGYPPPIPVNTPTPFDGFRSYAGLRARHDELAASTPWAHEAIIGSTRAGRDIRAYRLGDADTRTPWDLPEAATLTNGGIHAREWQSPEVVTGILERLATGPRDAHLLDYLRDQVNMVVIPVHNIDGFLQTQRTPTLNYIGADPDVPDFWPRDGRMRRKNMLGVDEDLFSLDDHLLGVDLNRNNRPYWNTTSGGRSSDNPDSLVHHGVAPQSEPEARALDAAAALGPVSQLRLYTDVHSYSLVHFWSRTSNERLAFQTEQVLTTFSNHHVAFPAGKFYAFADRNNIALNSGIGTTDEYFTVEYQVPSWTLEVEPSGGQDFHFPLPGGGADYGGEGVNGHDGFILPEAEIRRVREQLAETFTTVYYRQSGPPHVQSLRLFDAETGALVAEQDWDRVDDTTREAFQRQHQPLELGRNYVLWAGFSKPMRWLVNGEVARFPGASTNTLNVSIEALVGVRPLSIETVEAPEFALAPGPAPEGYRFYRTDALTTTIQLTDTLDNRDLLGDGGTFTLGLAARDMTGLALDADPATVVGWAEGRWIGYEDINGNASDFGGPDRTFELAATRQAQERPFTLEPGIAAAWFDPARNGEGFIIEMLPDQVAVLYWFTYDADGEQDWYIAQGTVSGNQLRFPELLRVSGGVFGAGFDADAVTRETVGAATFTWTGCASGRMDWHIGNQRGRQALDRLTRIQGLDCGPPLGAPIRQEAQYSGAWYDPERSGEGFTVAILDDNSALAYWFSFDPDGARRWFFGIGELAAGTWVFPSLSTTRGPTFGENFDPEALEVQDWGRLELDLSCEGGEARYESAEPGFGSGLMPLVQLTRMDGPSCPPLR